MFVSVNVAVRQVRDSDLVADVARILAETGLPAAAAATGADRVRGDGLGGPPLQALHALTDMGVRIAIDDFGTGYSNLAYLSSLPVPALKLDGSFVARLPRRRRDPPGGRAIVDALVQLAHGLGLTVTAEGVETPGQADRLRRARLRHRAGLAHRQALLPGRTGQALRPLSGHALPR